MEKQHGQTCANDQIALAGLVHTPAPLFLSLHILVSIKRDPIRDMTLRTELVNA
jgi:hypothetical protein